MFVTIILFGLNVRTFKHKLFIIANNVYVCIFSIFILATPNDQVC